MSMLRNTRAKDLERVQGKILIVDAISTNRIVLKVKLSQAYYEIIQASTIWQIWCPISKVGQEGFPVATDWITS